MHFRDVFIRANCIVERKILNAHPETRPYKKGKVKKPLVFERLHE